MRTLATGAAGDDTVRALPYRFCHLTEHVSTKWPASTSPQRSIVILYISKIILYEGVSSCHRLTAFIQGEDKAQSTKNRQTDSFEVPTIHISNAIK